MLLPEDFKQRMRAELGAEYEAFIAQYEKEAFRGFLVNTLKISPEELHPLFPYSLGQVEWCRSGFYYNVHKGRHPASLAGLIYSQEPSAMLAAVELAPKQGERVLDLCAAPGGKSAGLAAMLGGEGLLVANEIIPSRAAVLSDNLERLGVKNAVVTNMSPEKMERFFPSFFDKILVDAPCSGEGMFRRDAEAVREWSLEHTRSCAARQLKILSSAAEMLKGGGELVYSTCTFSRTENEEVCAALLKQRPDFTLLSQKRIMPHTHKGEGHFTAKFVKSGKLRQNRPPAAKHADEALYRSFEAEALNVRLNGDFTAFGDKLYLTPPDFGSVEGLRFARPGLSLGENKKGRFQPAHGLCMALKKEDFARTAELGDDLAAKLYRGEALPCGEGKGFAAALWHGFPLGWGKMVDGTLKNHIPKYLRG